MLVPKELLPEFSGFLKDTYGVEMTVQPEHITKRIGEIARGVLGERVLVIKEQPHSDLLEVWYSDPVRKNEIDEMWAIFLREVLEHDDGESDNADGVRE